MSESLDWGFALFIWLAFCAGLLWLGLRYGPVGRGFWR